ncbi:MAG: PA14 domain-containing protein, partial [Planctomycetota bacterium]|nr:PA14 domain-containing protein [Planctomycetota bacterium]
PISAGKPQAAAKGLAKSLGGVQYELFKLDDKGSLETIPDLATLRDKDGWDNKAKDGFMRAGILPTLTLPPREMWDVKRSQFAIRYTGNLHAPTTGYYIFELAAAGYSQLKIDGKTVGDNGFLNNPSARRYMISLEQGTHTLELLYGKKAWVNQRGQCDLRWEGPGIPIRPLTQSDLKVPDTGDIPILKTRCTPSGGAAQSNVVDISVDVTARGETVSRVDVFCGDLVLGQLTQAPFVLENRVLPDGDWDVYARVLYDDGKRTVDSNRVAYTSKGQVKAAAWKQTFIGVQGAGLGGTAQETADGLSLRITGDSHWFLNQEVQGDFSLTGRLVDFPTRTWQDPVYGHVQSRSWLGLMFALKPGEPCFFNAYGFYRLAGEGWRGTPCHSDLGGSRRTDYQYPQDTGDWIRLERKNMLFSTSRSHDGKNWELVRHCLISPNSRHAWHKGVVGVTFRQQPSDPGGAWAQGKIDHVALIKGESQSSPKQHKVKLEDAKLFKGRVLAVVQSHSSPKVWYARTYEGGILKSVDGGTSWNVANGNLKPENDAGLYVRSIAVHPKDANVVLAGLGSGKGKESSSGLYMTKDGGNSWRRVCDEIDFDGKGPSALLGEVISFNPYKPNTVAAGGESKGLFQSEDSGESWKRIDVETDLKCAAQRISCLQYNQLLDGHLTVATFPDAEFEAVGLGSPGLKIPEQEGGGIYSLGEKNVQWGISPYPGFGFSAVHMRHSNGSRGVGFFMSSRGAFKWERAGLIHSWPNVPHDRFYSQFAVGKNKDGHKDILVAAPFSSDDSNPISVYSEGKLAEKASSPVQLNAGISGIAFDLSDPGQRLFVCNRHGILRSGDRGKTYELVYKSF